MPFPVPTSVQLAVPVRRRRPCRFRLDDGLLGRRPCRFLRQRFLRRLLWHYLCRRPSCRSLSQRRPRLHRKRRHSSFVTLPALSAVQPPAPTVVRSRLRCLSRTDFRTTCRAGPSPTAMPLPTRRRPFRSTAVPLPASTLPAPIVVALLVSTAVVPLPQPTSPSAASKATALVVRDASGAICRAASGADGRA